jgi:carbon-monoxide dehydrogenase large subunit
MAFTTMMGAKIKRREDPRLITGRAQYVEDVQLVGTLYAAFVRSPYAHAKLGKVDVGPAKLKAGVFGAYSAADLAAAKFEVSLPTAAELPGLVKPAHPPLATGEVRFVGECVAVVVANDPYVARDAAEAVTVEYDELPVVVDLDKAAAGGPFAHSDLQSNIAYEMPVKVGEVDAAFAKAEVIVKERIVNQRVIPCSMEPRTMMAEWQPGPQQLTLWSSTQIPHLLRTNMALLLGLQETKVRVIAPEVGGGFGAKLNLYAEELLVCWLSMQIGKPVKFIETRSECFQAMTHGRDQIQYVEAAANKDGKLLGLRMKILSNLGAYHQMLTPAIATFTPLMAQGCYKIDGLECQLLGVFTNTMSTDAYRGAGRPEATYLIERMMDLVALEIGMDPVEIRRKNFIAEAEFPFPTVTGLMYDSGNYTASLDKALELADYAGLRAKQAELRKQGRYMGIGVSTYVEVCGMGPSAAMPAPGWDSCTIRVEPTGSVTVMTGVSPHGQGQETTFAQIVADRLGVSIDNINVVHGDTDKVQYGVGTFGSRGTAVGGAALSLAIDTIQAKAIKIAAHVWEANPDDVEFKDGKIQVKGDPSKSLTTAEVGFMAFRGINLPPDIEPGLDATRRFEPPNFVYPFGAHICVVEIDAETGEVEIQKYVAVDDCGPIINPLIVEGQVHGGLAQGISQALFEEAVYDENGQLTSGTFMDYAIPHAEQLLEFTTGHTETTTPVNPLGIKGVGEAGTIGSTPCVVNAVMDALAPFGVKHIDMPLRPEKLYNAMHAKGNGKAHV